MTLNVPGALLVTAAGVGLVHTLLGPDHYLPFIAMSRARRWTMRRTLCLTGICGVAHVLSSALIGVVGLRFGLALVGLEEVESGRGSIAGWLLLGFGFAYTIWGVRQAHRRTLPRMDAAAGGNRRSLTPWVLFTIFVFGPCEPLIPLLMYPAAAGSPGLVAAVTAVFMLFTVGAMLTLVYAASRGLAIVTLRGFERFEHALAGGLILLCGVGVKFVGL